MTQIRAVLPINEDGVSKVILPIGETYQLHIIGGSGLYKYNLPSPLSPILTLSYNGLINTKT